MRTLRETLERSAYPLLVAAEWHATDFVDEWLQRGEDVNQCEASDGRTALHMAAIEGCRDIAKLLIQYNANVDASDVYGNSPLHLAAERGNLEVVQIFLKAGADVNLRNSRHCTAEKMARKQGHSTIAETIRKASQTIAERR